MILSGTEDKIRGILWGGVMSSEEGLRWGPACSGGRRPRAKGPSPPERQVRTTCVPPAPAGDLAQRHTAEGAQCRGGEASTTPGRSGRPGRELRPVDEPAGGMAGQGSREGLEGGARGRRGHGPVTCPPAPGPHPRTTKASRTAAGNRGGHRKEAGRQVRPPVQLLQAGSPVCRAWPGVASGNPCFLPRVTCAFL